MKTTEKNKAHNRRNARTGEPALREDVSVVKEDAHEAARGQLRQQVHQQHQHAATILNRLALAWEGMAIAKHAIKKKILTTNAKCKMQNAKWKISHNKKKPELIKINADW